VGSGLDDEVYIAGCTDPVQEVVSPVRQTRTGHLVKMISGARHKFNDPEARASDRTHVWVANLDGNSVTELSARTGRLVKVISG
jgi:hypothetical protein